MKKQYGKIFILTIITWVFSAIAIILMAGGLLYAGFSEMLLLSCLLIAAIELFPLLAYLVLRCCNGLLDLRNKEAIPASESIGHLVKSVKVATIVLALLILAGLFFQDDELVLMASIMMNICFYMLFLGKQEQKKVILKESLGIALVSFYRFKIPDMHHALSKSCSDQAISGQDLSDQVLLNQNLSEQIPAARPSDQIFAGNNGEPSKIQRKKLNAHILSLTLVIFLMITGAAQFIFMLLDDYNSDLPFIVTLQTMFYYSFPLYTYPMLLKINQLFDFYAFNTHRYPKESTSSNKQNRNLGDIDALYRSLLLASLPLGIFFTISLLLEDRTGGISPGLILSFWFYWLIFVRQKKEITSLQMECELK